LKLRRCSVSAALRAVGERASRLMLPFLLYLLHYAPLTAATCFRG
jgi:hypothetical protein